MGNLHVTPETSSAERMHELSADCWCNPTVEHVEAVDEDTKGA